MAHNLISKAFAFLLTFIPMLMVSGLSIRTASDINGYTIGTMGFKGTLHGVEVELNGTVEQMYTEFSKVYPELVVNATAPSDDLALESRGEDGANYSPKDYFCCKYGHAIPGQPAWGKANAERISDGIWYLNHFNGVCNTGPGPGNCVRVSCSWNSAIFLCNDNGGPLVISCQDVASYARLLFSYGTCEWMEVPPNSFGVNYICGQYFDSDNYNVIIREDSC